MTGLGMKAKGLVFFVLLSIPFAALAAKAEAASKPAKVEICHYPPGNPANVHIITVGSAAVAAHLAHGDSLGACPTACRNDGTGCGDDAECCSGLCAEGTCATPCAEIGNACGSNTQCCSGVCEAGTCVTPCTEEGAACTENDDCCNGSCHDGTCGAACGSNGNSCETGDDCCSGICTDTSKTCASDCTIGGELNGPDCTEELDCCQGHGVCILDLCYSGEGIMCAKLGEYCNLDDELNAVFCCFNNDCRDNVCVAP